MPYNWRTARLQAGKLRHRIDLVVVNPVQDSTGGTDLNSDIVYANVWALVEPLAGSETLAAQSQMTASTFQVVLRYIGAAPSWQPNYNYVGGALVKDSNGYLQQAQSGGGTSGAAAPTWGTHMGDLTQDGNLSTGVVWKNLGPAPPNTGVKSSMQVWFNNRQFQITSVQNPDERNKMLCLTCVEINDSQQQSPGIPGGLN